MALRRSWSSTLERDEVTNIYGHDGFLHLPVPLWVCLWVWLNGVNGCGLCKGRFAAGM